MDICRLCLQPGTSQVRLLKRDLTAFYNIIYNSLNTYEDCVALICQFCWRRSSQFLKFVEAVHRSDYFIRSNAACGVESEPLHNYKVTIPSSFVICESAKCNDTANMQPVTRLLSTAVEFENYPQNTTTETKYNSETSTEGNKPKQVKYEEIELKIEPSAYFDNDVNSFDLNEVLKVKCARQKRKKAAHTLERLVKAIESNKLPKLEVIKKEKQAANGRTKSGDDDLDKASDLNMEPVFLTVEQQREQIEKRKQSSRYRNAMFKCEKCGLSFHCEDVFDKHLLKHSGPSEHECAICHYRFSSATQLKSHSLNQHSRLWRCARCGDVLSRRKWGDHSNTCRADKSAHRCTVCDKMFDHKYKLKRHIARSHEAKKNFTCDYCNKRFVYKFQVQEHIRLHTGVKPYSCNSCALNFTSSTYLRQHVMEVHRKKEEEPLSERYCVECDLYFKSKHTYRIHLMRTNKHATPDMLRFKCEQCPKKFTFEQYLKDHVNSHHTRTKFFKCEQCDKSFQTRGGLKTHLLNAEPHRQTEKTRNHFCEICGAAFITTSTLKAHKVAIHERRRPYKCTVCDATFGFQAALYTHNKLKHEKAKCRKQVRRPRKKETALCPSVGTSFDSSVDAV